MEKIKVLFSVCLFLILLGCQDALETNAIDLSELVPNNQNTVVPAFYPTQIMVNGVERESQELVNQKLGEEMGFKLMRTCACDNIQVWGRAIPLTPEEKVRVVNSEIVDEGGVISTDLNYSLNPSKITPQIGPLEFAKREKRTGRPVKVAVIDSGIDFNHQSLKPYRWRNFTKGESQNNCLQEDSHGYDFVNNTAKVEDTHGHGTLVAGIIANNENQDPNVELMNLKVMEEGKGDLFTLTCALQYAINNDADIINLSLGFYAFENSFVLSKVLEQAAQKEILIVTSAGNDGYDNDAIYFEGKQAYHFPSSYNQVFNNIVAVGALKETSDINAELLDYSNYGANHVDIAAPGENILSTYIDLEHSGSNPYGLISGTSAAAAQVTRAAAILLSKHPNWNGLDAKACMEQYAANHPIYGGGKPIKFGAIEALVAETCE